MIRERPVRLAVLAVIAAVPLLATSAGLAGASPAGATAMPEFNPRHFSHPAAVDNKWFPLAPGTQYILEGKADSGNGVRHHRVVFTVTDLTKVVAGVRSLVLWDRDYSDGRLVEVELAFHAQDDARRVWNIGEYPEKYRNGRLLGAPDTWIAGLDRARAGILMLAEPRLGKPSYSQGFAPSIEFADRAKVYATHQRNCVPVGCFDNVLVTDEWDALDPSGGHQRKYYAPGVGNIRVGAVGGDLETLVLVEVRRLCGDALEDAREQALAMDRRGHRVSEVYQRTAAARHTLRAPPC